jgi:hypothetical protein
MMDFEALVLGPNEVIHGRPVSIIPLMSQPGLPAYPSTAIWSSKSETFLLAEGTLVSDQSDWIGLRVIDLPAILPAIQDRVNIPGRVPGWPPSPTFWISEVRLDGQGGVQLQLRGIAE